MTLVLGGACLEIEITEGSFINHPDQVRTNLFALKNIGVHIAIDDFGTGYSNLGYLRNLPIDHLKIDQSFIQEMFLKTRVTDSWFQPLST